MRKKYELWQTAKSLGGQLYARKGDILWELDRVVQMNTIETGGVYNRNIHLIWIQNRIGGWSGVGAAKKMKTRVVVSPNGIIGTRPVYVITAKRFALLEWMLDCPLSREGDNYPTVYMPWSKEAKLRWPRP